LIEDQKKAKGDILGDWEAEPELFVDLSLLASDFTGEALSYSDGEIFILDRAGSRVASINSDTKRSEVVAGPDAVEDAAEIASYSDSIYLLTNEGIDEVNEGKEKVVEKSWQDDSLIHAFAGNLYVLDKRDSEILRFARLDEGFSTGSFWIAEGVRRDFSDVLSWTIDGNIWILKEGAEVLRFSLGNRVNFSLNGIFPEMESAADIYAGEETESLYLLDNARGRVVAVDKEGGFRAQYLSDEIKQATALVVSEDLKRIIILKENKLFLIEAKHLD
jgi:alpha/beta superfamily hydrolase